MLRIRRLLVPNDRGPCSADAYPYALWLAEHFGAEVHLVEADVPSDRVYDEPHLALVEPPPGVRVTRATVLGDGVVEVLLRYAELEDIDLVVMGTHGRRGLRHMMMGSVAEEAVRLAPCPVFTVRSRGKHGNHGRGGNASDPWAIQHVLAPVDLSECSVLAARHAAELAAAYGAELGLAFVIDVVTLPAAPYEAAFRIDPEDVRIYAQAELNGLVERLQAEVPALRGPVATHVRVAPPCTSSSIWPRP